MENVMETSDTVLVLRTCAADGTSYGAFHWPESGPVECDDWDPKSIPGHGLHGLLWGCGNRSTLSRDPDAIWQVVEVRASEVVDLDGAVKYPRGVVVYSGSCAGAIARITSDPRSLAAASGIRSLAAARGEGSLAAASGIRSLAAARGIRSLAAASGYRSLAAALGFSSTATAVEDGTAATALGAYSAATAVGRGSAATAVGRGSTATAVGIDATAVAAGEGSKAEAFSIHGHVAAALGISGRARAGVGGTIAVAWRDGERRRIAVGYVGEDGILPDVWYVVEDGVLVAE